MNRNLMAMTAAALRSYYFDCRELFYNATQMRKRGISWLNYEIEDIERVANRRGISLSRGK